MTTNTPRALLGDEKPVQAPAADPALDALDRLLNGALLDMWTKADANRADAATIRAALADRISPAVARQILAHFPEDVDLTCPPLARLGKIAEQGHDAALTARIIARNDREAGR